MVGPPRPRLARGTSRGRGLPPVTLALPCSGQSELFFAGDVASKDAARGLCEGCLVRSPCLERALEIGDVPGVWGGHDQAERRQLARARAHAHHAHAHDDAPTSGER